MAVILPGAHTDDNGPIVSGKIIETTAGPVGTPITLDATAIEGNAGQSRLFGNTEDITARLAGNPDGLVSEAAPKQ